MLVRRVALLQLGCVELCLSVGLSWVGHMVVSLKLGSVGLVRWIGLLSCDELVGWVV